MSKIYGIDLGTTNSLLGLGDKLLTGLVPSVVDLQTGKAGKGEFENMNAERSFKVDISLFKEGERSVAASACVLRQLVTESGQNVKDVVISVPAYFSDNQRQATMKAAELAGLHVAGLINEPTAAAIYASQKRKALSLVFDLGGGTFDVTVVDSRLGDYDVQATDGCILGGDNFDSNIRSWLIKEANLKMFHYPAEETTRLKWVCCQAKLQLQKTKADVEIDCSRWGAGTAVLTVDKYIELMKHTFSPAILKAKLVRAEAIPEGEPCDIILVGGSTRCPYLQQWVAEEMGQQPVEMFYDPDKIVALGACLYAQMVADGTAIVNVSDVTKALSLALSDGTCKTLIQHNSKVPAEDTTIVYNSTDANQLSLLLCQGDSLLWKNNEVIGRLTYDYGRRVTAGEGEVIVGVRVDANGAIHFSCKELGKKSIQVTLDRVRTGA